MARDSEEGLLTADTILHNLSKRPNVRSTLVLSRRDGSIIRATGSIVNNAEGQSQSSRVYSNTENNDAPDVKSQEIQDMHNEDKDVHKTEQTLSPVQLLAESIYTFVASASALSESLGKIDMLTDASRTRNDAGRAGSQMNEIVDAGSASQTDQEIQLLRLRLKKQEVIILPDPQYLCCVVQDLEKALR